MQVVVEESQTYMSQYKSLFPIPVQQHAPYTRVNICFFYYNRDILLAIYCTDHNMDAITMTPNKDIQHKSKCRLKASDASQIKVSLVIK